MSRIAISTVTVGLCLALLLVLIPQHAGAQKKKKDKAISTGKAAGIGALLGLALSSDPLEGAATGAALGAAGGMIANEATKGKREKQAAAESAQQQDMAAREQRLAAYEMEMNQALEARQEAEVAIVEAIGQDNWEGYKALRGCQHERASALAKVGATSNDSVHRLASVWLEAMTAVDAKNNQKAQTIFQTLAERDPEIDTVQQASLATDQAVLDMRAERGEIGIGPCR